MKKLKSVAAATRLPGPLFSFVVLYTRRRALERFKTGFLNGVRRTPIFVELLRPFESVRWASFRGEKILTRRPVGSSTRRSQNVRS